MQVSENRSLPGSSNVPVTNEGSHEVVCTSCNCASSASVFSPLIAANATFALNVGLWLRRVRLDMFPSCYAAYSPQSGRESTYRPVQFCPATSVEKGSTNSPSVVSNHAPAGIAASRNPGGSG